MEKLHWIEQLYGFEFNNHSEIYMNYFMSREKHHLPETFQRREPFSLIGSKTKYAKQY